MSSRASPRHRSPAGRAGANLNPTANKYGNRRRGVRPMLMLLVVRRCSVRVPLHLGGQLHHGGSVRAKPLSRTTPRPGRGFRPEKAGGRDIGTRMLAARRPQGSARAQKAIRCRVHIKTRARADRRRLTQRQGLRPDVKEGQRLRPGGLRPETRRGPTILMTLSSMMLRSVLWTWQPLCDRKLDLFLNTFFRACGGRRAAGDGPRAGGERRAAVKRRAAGGVRRAAGERTGERRAAAGGGRASGEQAGRRRAVGDWQRASCGRRVSGGRLAASGGWRATGGRVRAAIGGRRAGSGQRAAGGRRRVAGGGRRTPHARN